MPNNSTVDFYLKSFVLALNEELHPELEDVLNGQQHKHYKYNIITKKIRDLIKTGADTGLVDDKPKKGSSRAVLFHKEPTKIVVDGQETHVPTVLKIAFSGRLDKFLPNEHPLLGQMQNAHEIQASTWGHSILHKKQDGTFETNEDGFLPPIFDHHEDGDWMHVGKIHPVTADSFRQATKTSEHPKGITAKEFRNALNYHVDQANGDHSYYEGMTEEHLEKLYDHPLIKKAIDFSLNTGTNPQDFNNRNLGIWHHPITKKSYVVAADAGFSIDVMNSYRKARQASIDRNKYRY